MSKGELADLVAAYDRDGFAYVRGLFEPAELAPLIDALDEGGGSPGGFAVTDSEGGQQELSVWLELGDDLIGIIPRLEPVVAVATAAVGEPVYHWHSKLSWKRPGATSLWDWHQDYGFWSEFGVARPAMCTVAIALGPVDTANGCLQLIRGSHLLGTLPVEPVGQTRGSDPAAVAEAIESDGIEHCELALGDAVVFHANTLHGSGPNTSSRPRTMVMSSYNALTNPPTVTGHYAPSRLRVLPATALATGERAVFDSSPFIDPETEDLNQGLTTTMNDDSPR